MGLITYKPTTPSYRKTVKIDKSQLFKGRPDKSLIEDLQPNSGRNNTGKITIRHRSGGHKKKYRLVNFKRNTFDKIGTVERIEYDPNRSAFIALINYQDIKEYIIAPTDLKIGDKVISSAKTEISSGNAMKIKNIPTGTSIHNIELKPGAGGKLCRSAGSFAQVLGEQEKYVMVKLSSRETRLVHGECMATIGVVSNQDNKNKKIGKAGIKRHLRSSFLLVLLLQLLQCCYTVATAVATVATKTATTACALATFINESKRKAPIRAIVCNLRKVLSFKFSAH